MAFEATVITLILLLGLWLFYRQSMLETRSEAKQNDGNASNTAQSSYKRSTWLERVPKIFTQPHLVPDRLSENPEYRSEAGFTKASKSATSAVSARAQTNNVEIGADNTDSVIVARNDSADLVAHNDKSDLDARNNNSNLNARKDSSDLVARNDSAGHDARNNNSDLVARNDNSDLDARNDSADLDARNDNSDLVARNDSADLDDSLSSNNNQTGLKSEDNDATVLGRSVPSTAPFIQDQELAKNEGYIRGSSSANLRNNSIPTGTATTADFTESPSGSKSAFEHGKDAHDANQQNADDGRLQENLANNAEADKTSQELRRTQSELLGVKQQRDRYVEQIKSLKEQSQPKQSRENQSQHALDNSPSVGKEPGSAGILAYLDTSPQAQNASAGSKIKADEKQSGRVKQMFVRPDEQDDLKLIKGIGKVMEKTLHDLGITTFKQLASFQPSDVQRVSDALTVFPGRIERDNWVGQAKEFYQASLSIVGTEN